MLMEEETRRPHIVIGIIGAALLVLYVVLAVVFPQFKQLMLRFVSILIAVRKDYLMAYALVPIYVNWLATDYFQERRITSLGNAATNGFMGLWVGIDWLRTTQLRYSANPNISLLFGKILISLLFLGYAIFVIRESLEGRKIAHVIGRVREVSYLAIVVTPIMYGVVPFNTTTLIAILLCFPLFYGFIEFLEYFILPAPGTEIAAEEEKEGL